MHNPLNANVKVSRREMAEVGRVMAARLNEARGPVAVLVPLRRMVGVRGGREVPSTTRAESWPCSGP